MFDQLDALSNILTPTMEQALITLCVFLITLFFRRYFKWLISSSEKVEHDKKRQRLNTVDNVFNMILVVALIAIWLSELQNFAFSIAAFMVALVIATREFIQCIIGAFFKASTRPFDVGDWVRIGEFEGEVTDSDWLTTTLFEVDLIGRSYVYTGRTSVVPNSLLITHTVQNLNYMRRYVTHRFSIIRNTNQVNLFEIKEPILMRIKEYSEHFKDVAVRYNQLIEKRLNIKISGPEPSVRIKTNEDGYNVFTVSLFCPTEEAVEIEQKVTEDFMVLWYQKNTDNKI